MGHVYDRVQETTTTTGTGTLALSGASPGFQSFEQGGVDPSSYVYYCVASLDNSQWEIGAGTFTPPSSLSRDRVLSSSSGLSKVNFSAGIKNVFVTLPLEVIEDISLAPSDIVTDASGSITGFTIGGVVSSVAYAGSTVTVSTPGEPDIVLDADEILGGGTVTPPPVTYSLSTDGLSFSAISGQPNPASQQFSIDASDGSAVVCTITESVSWATVTPMTSNAPSPDFVVSVNNSGVPVGTQIGEVVATVTKAGGGTDVFSIELTNEVIAPAAIVRKIKVSTSQNRSTPIDLQGATITGNAAVFVPEDADIQSVDFFLNNATPSAPTGTPTKTENNPPFDFAGTTTDLSMANFYDFSAVPVSSTISAKVTKKSGGFDVLVSTFTRGGSAPPPSTVSTAKYEPGHYIRTGTNLGAAVGELNAMRDGTLDSGLKGVLIYANWSFFENNTKGQFSWASFDAIAAAAAQNQRYWFICVPTTAFGNGHTRFPNYLKTATYGGGYCTQYKGLDPATRTVYKLYLRLWQANVAQAYKDLMSAIASRYNANPWFVGYIHEEAIGPYNFGTMSSSNTAGVTADNWIAAWKSIFTHGSSVFTKTSTYYHGNWTSFKHSDGRMDVDHYLEHVRNTPRMGISWPDTTPGNESYMSPKIKRLNQPATAPTYKGVYPLVANVQDAGAINGFLSGAYTLANIYALGTSDPAGYRAGYMVWDAWEWKKGTTTVLTPATTKAFLRGKNWAINTAVPSSIAAG